MCYTTLPREMKVMNLVPNTLDSVLSWPYLEGVGSTEKQNQGGLDLKPDNIG